MIIKHFFADTQEKNNLSVLLASKLLNDHWILYIFKIVNLRLCLLILYIFAMLNFYYKILWIVDEDEPDTDYSTKYLSYGQRLGYHPEFSAHGSFQNKKRTPKEMWKEAYRKVLEQIQKSKRTFRSKEEVLSAWKAHKAHQSIFRVYEELTERRKMLELLRLSINIGPVASADVDKNSLLIAGMF